MINLTPIAKPIQERMFEKMRVLGRKEKYSSTNKESETGKLRLQDMATRTTFIRMTSGQKNPVVMMGGELSDDKEMRVGFADIYGPKTHTFGKGIFKGEYEKSLEQNTAIYKADPSMKGNSTTEDRKKFWDANRINVPFPNTFKRPMPGIKSIDVQFKGGIGALRTANISWTCWSFADLDRLMSHFLSHGKTVALEWGWVYNKKQFEHLPTLINSSGEIDKTGFSDYRKAINNSKGDFDFMNGVVKNFEFTSRDDGGFDCKTDIVSTGVSILNSKTVSGNSASKLKLYNIKEDDSPNEIKRKLEEIKDDDEQLKQIFYDSELSFSIFMTRFDRWLLNLVDNPFEEGMTLSSTGEKIVLTEDAKELFGYEEEEHELLQYDNAGDYKYVTNSFIVNKKSIKEDPETEDDAVDWRYDGWVRWGWFEDNILNKFYAMISKDNADSVIGILNEFRSVNRIIKNEEPTNTFESVKIKNHKFLESTNLKKYILPGQFEIGDRGEPEDPPLKTLDKNLIQLSRIVNSPDKFNSFAVDSETKREGYLRNILVHTEFLKECFDFTENTTISIGLQNMFDGLKENHNLWNFIIETDPVEANRMKIIDNNVTFYPWDLGFDPKEQKSEFNDVGELISRGVFTFPVWKNNSIVKRQNLTAKLPSSMQMAAMYGVNLDAYTNLRGGDQNMSLTGRVAGSLGKMKGTKDKYKSNADLAFRMGDVGIKLGRSRGDEGGPLNFKDGIELDAGFFTDTVFEGVKGAILSPLIEKISESELAKIPEELSMVKRLGSYIFGQKKEELKHSYLGRLASPATFPGGSEDFTSFIVNLTNIKNFYIRKKVYETKQKQIDSILNLYKRRYDSNMKLKSNFIDGMRYLLDVHGESRTNNVPVLVPLELELSIDGIGGIYPGNSYQSNYVPNRYQDEAMFQCFHVNHTVDSSGWTVNLTGKMRATLHGLYSEIYTEEENVKYLIDQLYKDLKIVKRKRAKDTVKGQLFHEAAKKGKYIKLPNLKKTNHRYQYVYDVKQEMEDTDKKIYTDEQQAVIYREHGYPNLFDTKGYRTNITTSPTRFKAYQKFTILYQGQPGDPFFHNGRKYYFSE